MEVVKSNFESNFPAVEQALKRSDFIGMSQANHMQKFLLAGASLAPVTTTRSRNVCVWGGGNGSFRPRVVSALSRFGPGSFWPGSIRPWVISAQFGGSFRLFFLNYQACYRRSTKYTLG